MATESLASLSSDDPEAAPESFAAAQNGTRRSACAPLARLARLWSSALVRDPRVVRWTYLFLIGQLLFQSFGVRTRWQWLLVFSYLFVSRTPSLSREDRRRPGVWFFACDAPEALPWPLLALSAATAWTPAWEQTRALSLGASTGILGGATAAVRFVALPAVALTAHALRTRAAPGCSGLADVIRSRYGTASACLYHVIVCYRLFTHVWMNAAVVADFYDDSRHSPNWWTAAALSVGLPLLAVWQAGARAAVYADALLGAVSACAVFALASYTLAVARPSAGAMLRASSGWTMSSGGDAIVVGVLDAATSVGFMDPVLTDRAFMATPNGMVAAFAAAAVLGAMKVVAAAICGVAAATRDGSVASADVAPERVAAALGAVAYQVVTVVVLSSALSAVNATLAAAARAWSLELRRMLRGQRAAAPAKVRIRTVWAGRAAAAATAAACILPLLSARPATLHALLASGTPALGLGWPLFYAAARPTPRPNVATPLVFLLPLCFSIALGLAWQISVDHTLFPRVVAVGRGADGARLAWTLVTSFVAAALCGAAGAAEASLAARARRGEASARVHEFRRAGADALAAAKARAAAASNGDGVAFGSDSDASTDSDSAERRQRRRSGAPRHSAPRFSIGGTPLGAAVARISETLGKAKTRAQALLELAAPENAPPALSDDDSDGDARRAPPPPPRRSSAAPRRSSTQNSEAVRAEEEDDEVPPLPSGPPPGCSWD